MIEHPLGFVNFADDSETGKTPGKYALENPNLQPTMITPIGFTDWHEKFKAYNRFIVHDYSLIDDSIAFNRYERQALSAMSWNACTHRRGQANYAFS
jgi:hypothetical protein